MDRETKSIALDFQAQERYWVQEALGGSEEAFEKLVSFYEESIYNFLWGRTRNQELAEELVQEVFVRAFESLQRFDPNQNFDQWLHGIAHHVEQQWNRRQKISRRALENIAEANRSKPPNPAASESALPVYQRVLCAIAKCPPQYHLPLSMRYLDEMSYEEIAEVLHLGPGQVKGILYRAKQVLKEHLADLLKDLDEFGDGEV